MFTGIIEEIGTIKTIRRGSQSLQVEIKAKTVIADLHHGDSISTNGVCLTVIDYTHESFTVDVMHETLNLSSLSRLQSGSLVNLERAMPANGRFGGHIVSGHIDGIGHITSITPDDNAYLLNIEADDLLLKYIIEKGSVCLDGVSLTVARLLPNGFQVSIIPHTWRETTLCKLAVGNLINIENDIVGKYIERFVGFKTKATSTPITEEFLRSHGF